MPRLLLLVAITFTLMLSARAAFAQDVVTDTVTVNVDGITRTLTVTFVATGVVSVDVAPISDTFASTLTTWLNDFWDVGELLFTGNGLDVDEANEQFDGYLALTDETPYPLRYTPAVRQFRFAIHTCRKALSFRDSVIGAGDSKDASMVVAIAPYVTFIVACYEQYQDAYVEVERIKAMQLTAPTYVLPVND